MPFELHRSRHSRFCAIPACVSTKTLSLFQHFLHSRPTHHSDGEVVVDYAVRHRVPSLVLICGCDIDLPAIQHQLRAVLDVPHYLQEALALVTSGREGEVSLEQLVIR